MSRSRESSFSRKNKVVNIDKDSIFISNYSNDLFWCKSEDEAGMYCALNAPRNPTLRLLLRNKSGLECLKIYDSLLKKKDNLTVIGRVTLRKWFESLGADYYLWIYKNSDLYPNFRHVSWVDCIGEGAFSKAHLLQTDLGICQKSKNANIFVVKLQKYTNKKKSNNLLKDALDEMKLYPHLCHENVMKILSCGFTEGRLWSSLEYANLGTLDVYISETKDKIHENKFIFDCFKQLAKGVAYLHSVDIIHRDIKSANIFLFMCDHNFSKICYKIGDYNLSRLLHLDISKAETYCGTPVTMAPEIIGNEPYTHKADIWSLMCVYIHFLCKRLYNPISVSVDVVKSRINQDNCFKNLIGEMYDLDPDKRPSGSDCLKLLEKYKTTTHIL